MLEPSHIPFAHHMLVASLPFVGPVFVLIAVGGWIAVHDRLRERRGAGRG
jgi:hypothetical protein